MNISAKEKRDQKLRRLRRRQAIIWVVVILLIVSLMAGSFIIYNSPVWRLKKIKVNGGKHITLSEIKNEAAIAPDTNLLKFPGAAVRGRLKKIAWIKEIKFSRRLPGTLIINITERRPFAEVVIKKDHYLIDRRGYVLGQGRKRLDRAVLIVNGLSFKKVKVGKHLASKPLKVVIKIISNLKGDLKNSLKSIAVPSIAKLTLYTKDNIEIVYGPAENMAKKNIVIDKILIKSGDKIIYINITVVENPVVRKVKNLPIK